MSNYLITVTQKTGAVSKRRYIAYLCSEISKPNIMMTTTHSVAKSHCLCEQTKVGEKNNSHAEPSSRVLWLIKAEAVLWTNSPALDKKSGSFAWCCCCLCCCKLLQMSRRFLEGTCNTNRIASFEGESVQSHLLQWSINVKENKAPVDL